MQNGVVYSLTISTQHIYKCMCQDFIAQRFRVRERLRRIRRRAGTRTQGRRLPAERRARRLAGVLDDVGDAVLHPRLVPSRALRESHLRRFSFFSCGCPPERGIGAVRYQRCLWHTGGQYDARSVVARHCILPFQGTGGKSCSVCGWAVLHILAHLLEEGHHILGTPRHSSTNARVTSDS